ncbi:MAG: tetratricopeptide repeat-containing sensor histidine kinase [Ignavibacteriales bacterium]|nr:tetratricopeptide repeat-containing sensor histidine kinase [Ignavibacteriales bacterium]
MIQKQKTLFAILLVFLLPVALIFSQNKVDTLLEKIKQKPDTTKIRLLNEFCFVNRNKFPLLALEAGQEAFKIAVKIEDKTLQAKSLNFLGVVHRNLGSYDKSISLYKRALSLAEEANDSVEIAYSYNNIGGIYRLEGSHRHALEYILKALAVFEKLKDKDGMAYCTVNIGLIYRRQQNYIKALEYLKRTFKIREEINDRRGKAQALDLIAEVYFDQENIQRALYYFMEAEKVYKALDDKKGLATVWGGIGGVYYHNKDYSKAITYRKQALEMSARIRFVEGEITNHNNLGLIYAKIGDYSKADKNFDAALKIAARTKEIYSQLECYKFVAQYNEIKKDFKNALFFSKKYHQLKDSVSNQENIAFVTEIESNYNAVKVEKENAILLKDVMFEKRQKNYWIIISLLVVMLSVFIYSRYHSKKITNLKLRELNAMKDKFFGIIAHDLRNPFAAIFGFTNILLNEFESLNDEEKKKLISSIDDSGRQTYKLLENLLYWSKLQTGGMEFNPKELNLNEIVLEVFFVLESTANYKKITLHTNSVESMTAFGDEDMIKTVLRNLISNGIKFTIQGGRISVNFKNDENYVEVRVEDNGTGISKEILERLFQIDNVSTSEGTNGEKGTGLGLILCKEFVEKNGGIIRAESELGKGSKFIFTIPTKNN